MIKAAQVSQKPLVLVTRPEDQLIDFSRKIAEIGGQPISAPMLKILPVSYDTQALPEYEGLIFTSANALRFFVPHAADHNKSVVCVGNNLARLLENAHFQIRAKAVTAEVLMADITSQHKSIKRWLYVRGQEISFDFKAAIEAARKDVTVSELTVYRAEKEDAFPVEAQALIEKGRISYVTVFSRRTAESFMAIIARHKLEGALRHIKVLCIRESVLECVQPHLWQNVYVSDIPTQDGMVERLKRLIQTDQ